MAFLKALLVVLALLVAGPALAANCAPYPYTLLNGTTADANLVMADFNAILNCANNNLAKNGANSDITSLSGLTTPLSTAQGGTGGTFTPANKAGDTFTGEVILPASTALTAPFNIPAGTAPAAPVNGDIWSTSSGVFGRVNGGTRSLSGWYLLQTQATTAGTSVTFTLPQSYSDVVFVVDGFKSTTSDSMQVLLSSDNVSYTASWSPTGSNPAGYIGTVSILHYTSNVGSVDGLMGTDAAAPVTAVPSSSDQRRIYRVAAGVQYVRFSTLTGTLSAGSITAYVR